MTQIATTPAMPIEESVPRRAAGRWSANLLLGLAVILLLLGLIAGSVYWRFHQQHLAALADVQAEVARIQAAGEPITPEDFAQFHRVPKGTTDTTPLWLQAIALSVQKKGPPATGIPYVGTGDIEKLQSGAPDSLLPAAETYLASFEDAIAATRRAAAAKGECRYPIDFGQGLNAKLDYIQDARQLSRLLCLRARVAAERGNVEQAIESIELLLALANSLEHEPATVSQQVRYVLVGVATGQVENLVSERCLTDEQLVRLQNRLNSLRFQESRKLAILGERGMGLHAFHHMSAAPTKPAGGQATLERPVDCLFYLEMMDGMLAAADNPAPEAMQQHKKVIDQVLAKLHAMTLLERSRLVLSAQVLPTLQVLFHASARAEAERDSAVAALAFRRFQLRHGRAPNSLAEMTPEFLPAVPRDPFQAGAPLIFVVTDKQFAIYSVGMNGKDERALLTDPDTQHDTGIVAPLSLPMPQPESNSTPRGQE